MPGDIKATATYGGSTLKNSQSDGGTVSVEGRQVLGDDASFHATFDGVYRFYQDDYVLVPSEALIKLQRGIAVLAGGLLYGRSIWNSGRIAGASLSIGRPVFNTEFYGGAKVMDTWEEGLLHQHQSGWILGAIASGGVSSFNGRVGIEHDITGWNDRTNLSSLVTASPFFAGGKVLLGTGDYSIDVGAHFNTIARQFGLTIAYERSNLPPFFPEIPAMAKYTDDRGTVSAVYKPSSGLALQVSTAVGRHADAVKLGVDTQLLSAAVLYRHDHDGGADAWGGTVYGKVPIKPTMEFRPYVSALSESAPVVSTHDTGLLLDVGGRITWAILRWLALSSSGGYMKSPLVGEGGYVSLNLVAGSAAGTGAAAPDALPHLADVVPSRGTGKFSPAIVPRFFGALLKAVAPKFSHKDHLEEDFHCADCHSTNTLIFVAAKKLKNECDACHDNPSAKIQQLAYVRHVTPTPAIACPSCHAGIEKLEAPTGGWGAIIKSLHETETWLPGVAGWTGHGIRQDATCGTCHAGAVQYDGHTVASCSSCHDSLKSGNTIAQRPHPDGWRGAGHVMEAKFDTKSCTNCHGGFSSCRNCHRAEGVMPPGLHAGIGFMKKAGGEMGHGKIAAASGGMLCAACHAPREFQQYEKQEPACLRCH